MEIKTRTPEGDRWRVLRKSLAAGLLGAACWTSAPAALLDDTLVLPIIAYDQNGVTTYEPGTDIFSVTATPFQIFPSDASITAGPDGHFVSLRAQVDAAGNLTGGVPGDDLAVTGEVTIGTDTYSGVLLTGEVTAFGFQDSGGPTDAYDFRFTVTGGLLAPLYATDTIGMTVASESSTFTGDFTEVFGGGAKGNIGALPPTLAALGDFVWEDLNGNGVQDNGEPGVADVAVTLLSNPDGDASCSSGDEFVMDTTTTGAAGDYLFPDLKPGDYCVQFAKPAGYEFTLQDQGGDDAKDSDADPVTGRTASTTLAAGDTDLTIDAGLIIPASLGDFVWNDTNRNGRQDSGEPGIGGVTVNLFACDPATGAIIGTDPLTNTSTAGNGFYQFSDLEPGGYLVEFVKPAGFEFTLANVGDETLDSDADTNGLTSCVVLASGEDNPDVDAGLFQQVAGLGDFVWEDLNANGIQDSNEQGIGGATATLLDPGLDGVCNTGDEASLDSTPTAADGKYEFTDLIPGRYCVAFEPPAELCAFGAAQFTVQNQGNDPAVDSDADPVTGQTGNIDLSPDEFDSTNDAGFFCPAQLGDRVWDDLNRDGIQDDGEPGLPDVMVSLFTCNPGTGEIIGSVTSTSTDAAGFYQFSSLEPGGYLVEFMRPDGFMFSPANQGADDAVDSDADTGTGRTTCTTLVSGEDDPTIDAGLFVEPVCDLAVDATCAIVPVLTSDFVCSDAKPIDTLSMIWDGQEGVTVVAHYGKLDRPILETVSGVNSGDLVTVSGFAGAGNDVEWEILTAAGDSIGKSTFHLSCSDRDMNGPEDCGKLQGDGKKDSSQFINAWLLEGMVGLNGMALQCTPPDAEPGVDSCTFETPAPPHCLGKVEALSLRYLGGDCIISNDQSGKAECLVSGTAGEPVRIRVSDGKDKVYLDTGLANVVVGDVVTATAAAAGESKFSSSSVIEIFSSTDSLVQEVEFHTSCSKPLNLGDQFGATDVVAMDTTEGGSVSLGAEVRFDYEIVNNSIDRFVDEASDSFGPLGKLNLDALGGTALFSRTQFVLPDASDVFTNTLTVTGNLYPSGTACAAQDSVPVTRIAPPVDDTCSTCEGKVTQLTLQYNGAEAAFVEVQQKKDGDVVFSGMVAPGGQFTFNGTDKHGTLGTEISIYVDRSLNAKIHTSCSKPIGPGLVAGDFEVIEGYSLKGGLLCPIEPIPPTCDCDGKVTWLTLQYNGAEAAFVEVQQKKDGDVVFSGMVAAGGQFTFSGTDKKGTLGTEISIYVDGGLNAKIHTSCSKPIGPGLVAGDFEVIEGYSRNGGMLCPLP